MKLKFRSVQLLGFILVVAIMGSFTTWAGLSYIHKVVLAEAKLRVEMDLNTAWSAYRAELEQMTLVVSMTSQRELLRSALLNRTGTDSVRAQLEALSLRYGLDFLTLITADEEIVARSRFPFVTGEKSSLDPIIKAALDGRASSGTVLMTAEVLRKRGERLAEMAYIPLVQTEKALPTDRAFEDRGLVLEAAIPIVDANERVLGAIHGGILLNRRFDLVDRIRDAVFGNLTYEGKPVGTVTIFLGDVRVATNVIQLDNTRAIGTRVWREVYDKVLEHGERFADRAFVVNDWYLSAYDPIRDPSGNVIGIVYVGLLEKKYLAYKSTLAMQFLGISFLSLVLSIAVALYLSGTLKRPISRLVDAVRQLSADKLDTRVHVERASEELQELAHAFNSMAESLENHTKERERTSVELKRAYLKADEKNRAYLETLGFVTHELKSPLASIVFALGSMREHILGPLNPQQEALLKAAANSADYLQVTIANYLNLTRIEEGELKLQLKEVGFRTDIINPVVMRLSEVAADQQMNIICEISERERGVCDPGLMTSVFQNLLSNAVKYGRRGGQILIGHTDSADSVSFSVRNEGEGFTPELAGKLFARFSRLSAKEYGTKSGTGLGLFVARQIVEKHGGRIWAESDPGSWAEFSFSIPKRLSSDLEPDATTY